MKLRTVALGLGLGAFMLVGCGGGSGDGPDTVTKVIMDDPIAGLNYVCSSSADVKTTGSEGKFTCNVDDTVTFYIGKYKIGSTSTSSGTADTLRIADLGVAEDAVTDVRQLLQTIDEGDDDGVITIPEDYDALDDVEAKPGDDDFDDNLSAAVGEKLVDKDTANKNAEEAYLKQLFAGKTFYVVKGKEDKVEKGEFNKELTTLQSGNDTMALTLNGKRITINSADYAQVDSIDKQYILIKVYKSNGTLDETMRFYFDKADADAYVATLSGGGSGGDVLSPDQRLIGIWKQDCQPTKDQWRSKTRIFDGKKERKIYRYFDDAECKVIASIHTKERSYQIGNATKDSEGNTATEINYTYPDGYKYYSMFGFTKNGRLLIADDVAPNDGHDEAHRANTIESSWTGYASSSSETQEGTIAITEDMIAGKSAYNKYVDEDGTITYTRVTYTSPGKYEERDYVVVPGGHGGFLGDGESNLDYKIVDGKLILMNAGVTTMYVLKTIDKDEWALEVYYTSGTDDNPLTSGFYGPFDVDPFGDSDKVDIETFYFSKPSDFPKEL